jgi:hypothetical protein
MTIQNNVSHNKVYAPFGVRLARMNTFVDISSMEELVKCRKVFTIYAWKTNPKYDAQSKNYTEKYCYVPWIHCNGKEFTCINTFNINKKTRLETQSLLNNNIMFPMNIFFKNIDELVDWMGYYYSDVIAGVI